MGVPAELPRDLVYTAFSPSISRISRWYSRRGLPFYQFLYKSIVRQINQTPVNNSILWISSVFGATVDKKGA
jgi:hypothetical protein